MKLKNSLIQFSLESYNFSWKGKFIKETPLQRGLIYRRVTGARKLTYRLILKL